MRKKINPDASAIRNAYAEKGVADFYAAEGHLYKNPHEPQVAELVAKSTSWWTGNKVWDLCCGSGEVSRAILKGVSSPDIFASDPFTGMAFKDQHPDIAFADWTFEDIAKGVASNHRFDAVYCSFALHLCPEDWLYQVCNQIFNVAPVLIIITPHKRPVLESYPDFSKFASCNVLTERGKQVFAKAYRRLWSEPPGI